MEAIQTNYFNDKFNRLQSMQNGNFIGHIRKEGFKAFNKNGIPTIKNEEWKYTGISNLFKKEYLLAEDEAKNNITPEDIDACRLPGFEEANELVFINGKYAPELSVIRSSQSEFEILPLEEAAGGKYKDIVQNHFNKSSDVVKDGLQALNTSFIYGGVFMYVHKNKEAEHPVYLYHIADARENHVLVQPRSLIYTEANASLHLAETFATMGSMDSFTNGVMEIVAGTDARIEYYKIQNDVAQASQVSTTHIRQIGKSFVNTVVISLNGGMIRNNMNLVLEAAYNEAHMYGLYLLKGHTHVDNHTMVDNREPNCFSNEYYKGILDEYSSGVFNGKIFVRPDAQKTNAYQSNKNILLSDEASINTKPQLEIFADDVKCSHGCTVGQLDEEALFYLRSRGISEEHAKSMLLNAFASDVVQQIKLDPLRDYAGQLITNRLSIN
ncbi:MAG TPA: Fe-S cluster assembly protein SufD [Chitinophagaceae bacterium]|nr:Fe-S cluster assembly protein SufD [Chitinophagaceae bacterium]